jgi:hypothetical protein
MTRNTILFGVTTAILVLGGLPWIRVYLGYLSVLGFGFILISMWKSDGRLVFPRGTNIFSVFIIIQLIGLWWASDVNKSLDFIFLLASGFLIWIFSYNLSEKYNTIFLYSFWISGVLFSIIFILRFFLNLSEDLEPWSLYGKFSRTGDHYMIGNYWGIIMVSILAGLHPEDRKPLFSRKLYIPILLLGLVVLILAGSRSAFLSVLVGTFAVFWRKDSFKFDLLGWVSVFIAFWGLVINSLSRSVLFARPYYLQVWEGFIKYPFGVGLGNFGKISSEFCIDECITDYSTHTMNFILEIISGTGILGIPFAFLLGIFMAKVISSKNNLWKAVFLATAANFMFIASYNIPSIFWVWMVVWAKFLQIKNVDTRSQ